MSAEQRKAAIIETAVRLFAEKGFRGTTTRELAAAVGVSEPVLYQHFATKRGLYKAIIEAICANDERDEALEKARAAGDDYTFFARLAELILQWHDEQPQILRLLLFSALEGHELKDLFVERQVAVLYEILTEYIERRQQQGAFRAMDSYLAARVFTGMASHQGVAKNVFGLRDLRGDRKQIAESIAGIFLDGMKNSRSEAE
ncbi:MAG: TetR/AcrR family transcriptional regulator [Dehalococcoidales bacterium]|nr:TetR/AcrR family transcriptional regulator [Dehalococcoidales bacterium]